MKQYRLLAVVFIGLLISTFFVIFYWKNLQKRSRAATDMWDFKFQGPTTISRQDTEYNLQIHVSAPSGRKIRALNVVFSYPESFFTGLKANSPITYTEPFRATTVIQSGAISGTNQVRVAVESATDQNGNLPNQSSFIANVVFSIKPEVENGLSGTFSYMRYELVDDLQNTSYAVMKHDLTVRMGESNSTVDETPTPTPTQMSGGNATPTPTRVLTPTGGIQTPVPVNSSTVTPTSTITVTQSPSAIVSLKLRFQGIQSQPQDQFNQMNVKVIVQDTTNPSVQFISESVPFKADVNGVWSGEIRIPIGQQEGLPPGSAYKVYVKGPKHLQKRICDERPLETYPGTYSCLTGQIRLFIGTIDLNFSRIVLLAGDLPDQDGIVNAADVARVYNILNLSEDQRKSYENRKIADINLDGIVNAIDYSLIQGALSVRSDEQ